MERQLPKTLRAAIAARFSDRVEQGWTEQDDWNGHGTWAHWINLTPGWCNWIGNGGPGLHIIHESTVKEVIALLKECRPCDCDQCKKS